MSYVPLDPDHILPATEVNTRTAGVLKEFASGERDLAVIHRRGKPMAAMMSIQHLKALLEELEQLRAASAGTQRLETIGDRRPLNDGDIQQALGF
ncbi:MAG: type II toxin-antitoxin system Phd/YefM family antitoxin [Pseudomonadales bacterium]|nr:type II toxin-antitoxin system Phd/YefM family antitoxin [Pseudomonadales bacterium]